MTSNLPPQLCDTCTTIDFSSYFLPPSPSDPSSKDEIGTLTFRELDLGLYPAIQRKSSTCAFCALALAAIEIREKDRQNAVISMSSFCYGRNKDDDGAEKESAYCIQITSRFRTDHIQGRRLTGYVVLLAEDAGRVGVPSTTFLGRVPGEEGVDIRLARRWLEVCMASGGEVCNTVEVARPEELLVIDVLGMCVCELPQGEEYLALSYCWPATPGLTLKRGNRRQLAEKGALRSRFEELPGTIRDAVLCTQEMAMRYLWIDALCIVQDDPAHKDKQLRQMDRVYSCAVLTIASAYPVERGVLDPCDGLPGYRKGCPARKRECRKVKGRRMMVASSCSSVVLLDTRWYTRCWYVITLPTILQELGLLTDEICRLPGHFKNSTSPDASSTSPPPKSTTNAPVIPSAKTSSASPSTKQPGLPPAAPSGTPSPSTKPPPPPQIGGNGISAALRSASTRVDGPRIEWRWRTTHTAACRTPQTSSMPSKA